MCRTCQLLTVRLETEERNVRAAQEAEEGSNSEITAVPVRNYLASLADSMMFDRDANGNWQEAHIGQYHDHRPTNWIPSSISP